MPTRRRLNLTGIANRSDPVGLVDEDPAEEERKEQEEPKEVTLEAKRIPTQRTRPVDTNRDAPIEYQLGICKDYLETGFCVFGDACIFAHIRYPIGPGYTTSGGSARVSQAEMDLQLRSRERDDVSEWSDFSEMSE